MRIKTCIPALLIVSITLMSCGTLSQDEKIKSYLNGDVKNLNNLGEEFQLTKEEYKIKSDGTDIDYKELSGSINVLNIYNVKETEETILYNSKFNSGSIRVILVKPNGEVVDIVRGNGDGSKSVKVPVGRSIIKLIGANATGNLKINVPSLNLSEVNEIGSFSKDGTYIFYRDMKVDGNNVTLKFFRVNVVNKKIDKIAEIGLAGVISAGKVICKFNNDGWGNSGVAEVKLASDNSNIESINIKIQNRAFSSAQWGVEEGSFFDSDEKLPDIFNNF